MTNDQKMHISKEQLKTLRAALCNFAEYAGKLGLEIELFIAEVMGAYKGVNEPEQEESDDEEE